MPETHINAYYADLITAKQEAAVANQRVTELEDTIKARGGVIPDAEVAPSKPSEEAVASSNDVSAVEKSDSDKKDKK